MIDLRFFMFSKIKNWYNGETKIYEFRNDPDDLIFVMPMIYTEYHWSAKIARSVVVFYITHWKWIWSSVFALLGLYVAVLSLK